MAERSSKRAGSEDASQNSYRAPALEKGLDVLELLAVQSDGLTLSQIAQSMGRSVQEVYRVVVSLERRGYVARRPPGDALQLSMKLFDLASNHPPIRRLVQAALPVMQDLAEQANQTVILSVLDGSVIRVIHVAESPAPIGFRVRLGTQSPVLKTASGRTLLAFQPDSVRRALTAGLVADMRRQGENPDALAARVSAIRRLGYERVSDETLHGITDVSFPILGAEGAAHAAMTLPFLDWVANTVKLEQAERHLFASANALSVETGGQLTAPIFPLTSDSDEGARL
jgi:DNA-binding IclR family transcriptional regulator